MLDLSNAKRIFLLSPSQALYLLGSVLSQHAKYATPLGDLLIDQKVVGGLDNTGKFDTMSEDADETEYSLEMHLPYIYKMLSRSYSSPTEYPGLVPILVGSTKLAKEREYGAILAPYVSDSSDVFLISLDFCHWGRYYIHSLCTSLDARLVAEGIYSQHLP